MSIPPFYTYTPIKKWQHQIEHQDPILLIGSCFAHTLGSYVKKYKFDCLLNPFGTLYNPLSIAHNIRTACSEHLIPSDEMYIEPNDGLWKHYEMHGDIQSSSQEKIKSIAKNAYQQCQTHIKKAKWIVITYGSSYVYKHKELDKYVANCHKMPSNIFSHRMLECEEIENSFQTIYESVNKLNTKARYILSISPVRYNALGMENNSRSKARLIHAVEKIINRYENTHYFPSYELMMDELRDYRFYEEDRIHPNNEAKKYIWSRFSEVALAAETQKIIKEMHPILQALNHRILNPKSNTAIAFCQKQLSLMQELAAKYPYLDFEEERQNFFKVQFPFS